MIGEITGRPVPDKPMKPLLVYSAGAVRELASYVTGKEPDITVAAARLVSEVMTCDSSKAVRELAYQPRPLRQSLEECFAWMVSERLVTSPAAAP